MARLARVFVFPVPSTLCKHVVTAEFCSRFRLHSPRDWRVGMYKAGRAGKWELKPEMVNPGESWALDPTKSQGMCFPKDNGAGVWA